MKRVFTEWTAKVQILIGALGNFPVVCVLVIEKCRYGIWFLVREIFSNLEMVNP
jgi:hypothetical protein